MKAFRTLLEIEVKLVLRHPDVILFGILFPVGMAVLFGIIYGDKMAFEGAEYTSLQQSFGGFIAVGICATGLMGFPLNLANYRHRKILRQYKATPVSPGFLLFIQALIYFAIAAASGLLVYGASASFGYVMAGSVSMFILAFLLVGVLIFSLGMLIASVAANMKQANLLCTILYFPMLFLSGATIPYEIMPDRMQSIVNILPLTQGIKLLKSVSLGTGEAITAPLIMLPLLALVFLIISIKCFRWE